MLATNRNPGDSTASKIMDEGEHHVIMQVSRFDGEEQPVIVSQIKNLLKSLPNARVTVAFHSRGLPVIVAKESMVASDVDALVKRGVIFVACENTMEKKEISKEDLLPGVTTVPSVIAELVLKQEQGWIYVKIGL